MGFWKALKQVWTIARHSVLQAARMRVVLVLAAFLLVLVPTLPFLLTTQNTRMERLQMVITYCVYLLSFLLGVLTLFLSSNTLNTEIKNQHIFLLDPKPVSRGVLLLGKWCGVMLIDLILLVVMMGAAYGVVRYMARSPVPDLDAKIMKLQKDYKALQASHTPEQAMLMMRIQHALAVLEEQFEDQARVQTEILTARRVARPQAPDITAMVNAQYEKRKADNLLEADKSEAWEKSRLLKWLARWNVPPRTKTTWLISGVPKLKKGSAVVLLFLHTVNSSRPDYNLPGEFVINEGGQAAAMQQGDWAVGKMHTLAVSADVVAPDGTLKITYTNLDPEVTAQFPFDDGIQVLYPVAPLAENFVRGGLVILMRLTFIAIVGIFASTFLSYPVAVLLNMLFFVVGYLAPFIFNYMIGHVTIFGNTMVPPWAPVNRLDALFRWVLVSFFALFPDFDQFNIVPDLSDGILISTGSIVSCFVLLPLVRGGVLAIAAWIIFNRRELAAVSPTA